MSPRTSKTVGFERAEEDRAKAWGASCPTNSCPIHAERDRARETRDTERSLPALKWVSTPSSASLLFAPCQVLLRCPLTVFEHVLTTVCCDPQRLPVQGEQALAWYTAQRVCLVRNLGDLCGAAQLLLIGDSGVGKSCLLLRFAVGTASFLCPPALPPLALLFYSPERVLTPSVRPAGRYVHRELHLYHRRGLCEPCGPSLCISHLTSLCLPRH